LRYLGFDPLHLIKGATFTKFIILANYLKIGFDLIEDLSRRAPKEMQTSLGALYWHLLESNPHGFLGISQRSFVKSAIPTCEGSKKLDRINISC